MNSYTARHTCDETGSRYPGPGPIDYQGPDLSLARAAADSRTTDGQCGYVIRTDATGSLSLLMPGGNWDAIDLRDELWDRGPDGEFLPNP